MHSNIQYTLSIYKSKSSHWMFGRTIIDHFANYIYPI